MAAGWLVARDELWEIVEPLILSVQAADTGRPRVPDRTAFGVILFVLFTGTTWKQIPREPGCSGSTAHERFTAWAKAGVFERGPRQARAVTRRMVHQDSDVRPPWTLTVSALSGGRS
jgi:transposase